MIEVITHTKLYERMWIRGSGKFGKEDGFLRNMYMFLGWKIPVKDVQGRGSARCTGVYRARKSDLRSRSECED